MPKFEPRIFSSEMIQDPYPTYAQLRREAPVYREPQGGVWVLTRHHDVYDALKDHETFSSRAMSGVGGGPTPLIGDDPPRHTRLRALVNRAFTPRRVAEIEPWIAEVSDELLDKFDPNNTDAVAALTTPLPVVVIARLMGIPAEDRERFKYWSDAVTGLLEGAARDGRAEAIGEMFAYFSKEIGRRRSEPMDDLIAALVDAEVDGEQLKEPEILGFCLLLLVAGNETTTNLIGNLLNILAARPQLWERLRADRSLVEPVIEETLRFDSPVQFLFRVMNRDLELHGETMNEGDRVYVSFASANRDDEGFPNADEFRVDRELNRHIAFGYGIHYCLGAPLARAEARIALNGMLNRFETISTVDGDAGERLPSSLLRGFGRLPLRFERAT